MAVAPHIVKYTLTQQCIDRLPQVQAAICAEEAQLKALVLLLRQAPVDSYLAQLPTDIRRYNLAARLVQDSSIKVAALRREEAYCIQVLGKRLGLQLTPVL